MSESPVVKRVTVTFDELPMPPFTDQFGESEDKALAIELLRLSREIRVLLGQFLRSFERYFARTPMALSKP